MATYFATVKAWSSDSSTYNAGDYLVALPEGFSGTAGVFAFKIANGRTPSKLLPYAPNRAAFNVIFHTDIPAASGITGPGTTTNGAIVVWTSTNGTTIGDGPLPSDFVQDGDDATVLGSGAQPSGQVLESDGAGGTTWVTPAAGGGDVVGPASATDNAAVRFDGTTGKLIQNGVVTIGDTGAVAGVLTLNGSTPPAAPGTLATLGTNLNLFGSGAATAGQVPSADGAGAVNWSVPAAGGDVVGPASAVDGHIVQFDGITGKLIKDGLATSTGGNGTADAGKVPLFSSDGGLSVSNTGGSGSAMTATSDVPSIPAVNALSNDSGAAGAFYNSSTGDGVIASVNDGYAVFGVNNSTTNPAGHLQNLDPSKTGDLGQFHNADDEGLIVQNDGSIDWTSPTGAQNTATNLPVFGALTKGVVPAAGAVPAATNFLTETGTFAVPAGTGVPTSRTISTAAPLSGGGDLSANRTLSIPQATSLIDGFLAAADWVVFNAKQAAISFGTGVLTALGINVGTAGSVVVNGGALGTPSSGTATNLTGTASGLTAGNVTTNANLTGPVTSVGNATTIADPELAAIAALTSAADKTIQYTGSGTAALADLKLGTEAAYTGTITWTAGAAPSGTANLRQFYTQIGNLVTWQISLTYATTGTTVTNVSLTFPTEFPTPAIPTGFTGASVKIWPCPLIRCLSTPSGTIVTSAGYGIYRNAGDTGFEISGVAFSSGPYRTFQFYGTYFTA